MYFIFLSVLLSLKMSIHRFPFSPISSVSHPTLLLSAHLSLGPTHMSYTEGWHIENWAGSEGEKAGYFAGAVKGI